MMLQSVETWTRHLGLPPLEDIFPPARDYGIDTARLESRRVYMRPMESADGLDVVPLLADPARTELFFQEPWTKERIIQWLDARACWVFRQKRHPEPFIALGVGEMDAHRSLTVHAISSGLATGSLVVEAARLGIAVAFERLGARRIVATPIQGNKASIKLVRHLGFRHEGTMRQAIHIAGRYRDIGLYALLKED